MSQEPTQETIGEVGYSWPPLGEPERIDKLNIQRDAFVRLCQELAARERPSSTVVLVSHREGIWQLQDRAGLPMKHPEYCGIEYFQYNHKTQQLSPWLVKQFLPQATPVQCAKTLGSGLEAILASGTGQVLIHLKGRQRQVLALRNAPGGTASAEVVQDGELVELCSVPQPAEGGAGDFVLVQCHDGRKGWLKSHYVQLALDVRQHSQQRSSPCPKLKASLQAAVSTVR
eukprot:6479726-Amphidinium_carterae.1